MNDKELAEKERERWEQNMLLLTSALLAIALLIMVLTLVYLIS